ncbi:MAG: Response regulator of zinc sigma-54-dependent two-component system [Myxococcales bacterium]|nr:Response regulator of zinc sigma-54-dependent two-component system [Myxococcales bacterium]
MDTPFATRAILRGSETVRLVRTCLVEVLEGAEAGTHARLERPIFRIGTHATNDLVLSDATVSKHHLEIAVVPEGYRISDLGSSNGTLLGTARLGALTIAEPVTLTLGTTVVRIAPTDEEAEVPASPRTRFGGVVGRSVVMRELFDQLEAVAKSDVSLLLEGETGVGKEQIADAVHQLSARAQGPFVVVDCGALVGDLMEAELFGHAKGAFSGADRARQGLFEAASGGTLFLDEVGELPPSLQPKLLGVLERRRVLPLGHNTPRPVDVRIIAATHKDLAREVNEGRFRADLFYRLAVARLRVPPLRERKDDIPELVQLFVDQLRLRYGEAVPPSLSAVVVSKLAAPDWPGNVRELRNAVERAALQTVGDAVEAVPSAAADEPYQAARDRYLADFERAFLAEALRQSNFNVTQAARQAGVELRYFRRLLGRYGLTAAALRPRS